MSLAAFAIAACATHTIPPPKPEPQTLNAELPAPAAQPRPKAELPLGGREIFPRYRLVGFCGTPGAPALGKLHSKLPERAKEMEEYAKQYSSNREVLPIFELIAVVVQGMPGPDRKHRHRVSDKVVDEYLRAAREAKGLLVLNVQPGHSDFMTEIKAFEKYLHEPDVGVALDPEWAMKAKQTPGQFYGQTTGSAVNEVAEYLANIVREDDLPEKALIFHQVNDYVLKDEAALKSYPGVVLIKSVDGLGPKTPKTVTYNHLSRSKPAIVHAGFKLFFDEDTAQGGRLMTPADVLSLMPEPEYVMYE